MSASQTHSAVAAAEWLGACRRAVASIREVLAVRATTVERGRVLGLGEGGDETLVIDAEAEDAVFAELAGLRQAGHAFRAVSEERGDIAFGGEGLIVVVDPIDGSRNALRGLPHHALSIAVADGPTMADVAFGFVHDFGPDEEWLAIRGEGAYLNGERVDGAAPERRTTDGRLEMLGIESAEPVWVAERARVMTRLAERVRAIGSIALTLCQVAAARLDAMASLRGCRAIDAAAGQLVAREAGALVAFPLFDPPLSAPLDLLPHSPVIAARTPEALAEVSEVPCRGPFT